GAVRARDPATRGPHDGVPALGAVDPAPTGGAVPEVAPHVVQARAAGTPGRTLRLLVALRSDLPRSGGRAVDAPADQPDRAAQAAERSSRPRAARQTHPGLRRRLQAWLVLRRLPADVQQAERQPGDHVDRAG